MARENDLPAIPETLASALAERLTQRHEAIAVGNRAGVIEWTNAAWRRVTGWALDEVVDKPLSHLLDRIGLEHSVLDFVQSHFTAGRSCSLELSIDGPDGRMHAVHLEVEPLADADGEVDRFLAIATDVSARRIGEAAVAEREPPLVSDGPVQQPGDAARMRSSEALVAEAVATLREVDRLCAEIEQTTRPGLLDELGVRAVRERALVAGDRARALLCAAAAPEREAVPVDLSALVARIVESIVAERPPRVQFDVVLDPSPPIGRVQQDRLARGVESLMRTGVAAIEGSWGTLSVTTGVTTPGRALPSTVYPAGFAGPLRDEAPRGFIELHDTATSLSTADVRRIREGVVPTPGSARLAAIVETCALLRGAGVQVEAGSLPGCGTRILLLADAAPVDR